MAILGTSGKTRASRFIKAFPYSAILNHPPNAYMNLALNTLLWAREDGGFKKGTGILWANVQYFSEQERARTGSPQASVPVECLELGAHGGEYIISSQSTLCHKG